MKSSKRPYPRKTENERRIVISFSLSGDVLKNLRERLEAYMHSQPTKSEVQAFARSKAYEAIEDYLASPMSEPSEPLFSSYLLPGRPSEK